MFVYWFRYTCLLILHSGNSAGYAGRVAAANRLRFLNISNTLAREGQVPLDPLRQALEDDYHIVRYLLQHASGLGVNTIEQRVMLIDYRLMQCWYRLTRKFLPAHARGALVEMSGILAYFADAMGRRAASVSHV